MNKLFLTVMLFAMASVSQAAFIACTPSQSDIIINAVGNSTVFNCSTGGNNINGDGLNVTQIRIRVSATFQENSAPSGSTFSVLASSVNNGAPGFVIGNVTCTATGNENGFNQALGHCDSTSAFASVVGTPDSISAFTVTVTGQPGSIPLPFNASASVAYEVNTTTPGVPEPTSMILFGTGFLAIGLVNRFRKARN